MSTSPDSKTGKNGNNKKTIRSFSALMENNKFIFALSLVIAFFVWAAVAMYKSPEESFTIYNVPIAIDTENSFLAQKNYESIWQSDSSIDVTVIGPRYLISGLTSEDIVVSAVLNNVDSAGIAELPLKVSLKTVSQDITVSAQSKSTVDVYFDSLITKEFDIKVDDSAVNDNVAEGYDVSNVALTVSTVELRGPATEIDKIINVVATPLFESEKMFKTSKIPVSLSLEGNNAADTVSVNKYVTFADDLNYFVNIEIDEMLQLEPTVEFTGTSSQNIKTTFDVDTINVRHDTGADSYTDNKLVVLKIDYSSLSIGTNVFTVNVENIDLPNGMKITDNIKQIAVTIIVFN